MAMTIGVVTIRIHSVIVVSLCNGGSHDGLGLGMLLGHVALVVLSMVGLLLMHP